jgi:membrane associated rhomboid family serine protease
MFFCLPVKVGQRRDNESIPIINAVLIAVNILVFLFPEAVTGSSHLIFSTVAYCFVHTGFWHLFCNMWVLWIFGNRVNRRLGNFWYAIVYLGSAVIIGVLLRLLLRIEVFGASGAVFAVVAVCLILMPGIMIEVLCVALFPLSLLVALFSKPSHWVYWLIRFGRFRIKALWCLFILPALEILGLFWWGWNWTNLGHLLGLVCGVGAVLVLPRYISMGNALRSGQLSYELD